jgi:hypothetical protein
MVHDEGRGTPVGSDVIAHGFGMHEETTGRSARKSIGQDFGRFSTDYLHVPAECKRNRYDGVNIMAFAIDLKIDRGANNFKQDV